MDEIETNILSVVLHHSLNTNKTKQASTMPVSTQSPDRNRPLDDDKVTGVSRMTAERHVVVESWPGALKLESSSFQR
jgi:hypothetical protein